MLLLMLMMLMSSFAKNRKKKLFVLIHQLASLIFRQELRHRIHPALCVVWIKGKLSEKVTIKINYANQHAFVCTGRAKEEKLSHRPTDRTGSALVFN